MLARAFALLVIVSALAVVLASPGPVRNEKRVDIGSVLNSLTSAGASEINEATSAAASVLSQATQAAGSAVTFVTSVGGSAYTYVTAQGTYYSIATNAAGSAYSVGISAISSATASIAANTNAAAQGLRADWIVSFPLLTTLLAVTCGIFVGAAAVF